MIVFIGGIAFLAFMLIIIALFGMSQPRVIRLERSVEIKAPITRVYPEVSSLRNFTTWNAWSAKDPSMEQTFTGEDGETGSAYSWKGNKSVGTGKMEMLENEPGSLVVYAIDFGPRGSARSSFVLEDMGDETKVTWAFESDMGNALRRGLLTKMMKAFITKDYDTGLANLKQKTEA